MLDIKYIKKNLPEVQQKLATRGVSTNDTSIVNAIQLDDKRIEKQSEIDTIKAEKNSFSKTISSLSPTEKKKGIANLAKLSKKENLLKAEIDKIQESLTEKLRLLPNIPSDASPVGKSDKDNVVVKEVGTVPSFNFTPLDYMTLSERLDLIDTERAAKVSGSRFGYIKGHGALLWNALVQYTLEKITTAGFTPFYSPVLVREDVMRDSGYDSYLEGQEAYHLAEEKLYLVGTGEHALLPYHRDEILDADTLPRKYTTYSACFRREAGSYGKDTKGILRVHQFDKQEMVVLSKPEKSWDIFDQLVALQEDIIQGLGLHYHLLEVSTGDLPRPSARVVDLECFIPSEKKFRETHSASNCTDYQARANNIRYKSDDGTDFVHILNATAITPRTLIAVIEQYQKSDGSIALPEVLQPYTFGLKNITV